MDPIDPIVTATEYIAIKGGTAPSDVLLAGASDQVRGYCGWHVAPVITQTVRLDGPGGHLLVLPTLRVEALVSVSSDGTALDVTGLEWSEAGMVRHSCWSPKFRGVQVEYRHGFDAGITDLRMLVCDLIIRSQQIPTAAVRQSAGGVSVEYHPPGLTVTDRAVLDRFRLVARP